MNYLFYWWSKLIDRKPTLKELLLAMEPVGDFKIPSRGRFRRKPPKVFE